MRNKNLKTMEISRDMVAKFLYTTMIETIAKGLEYDEDARKNFTEEEFADLNNDFILYGNLFGTLYMNNILNKLDNMFSKNKKQNEEEE